MNITVTTNPLEKLDAQGLLVTIFKGQLELTGPLVVLDKLLDGVLSYLVESGEIRGEFKEFTVIHTNKLPTTRILVMGIGTREQFSLDRIRSVAGRSARLMRRIGISRMAVASFSHLGVDPREAAEAVVQGVILGSYRFIKYKHVDPSNRKYTNLTDLVLACEEGDREATDAGAERGRILANCTNLTRDLVNEPSNECTPTTLGDLALSMGKTYGLEVTVLDETEIFAKGMRAFMAVAQGSIEPAKLILMRYQGNPQAPTLALVGKAITFDSGGISLKKPEDMMRMHGDMAAGAAVMSVMQALAQLKPELNVRAIIPCSENLPSGHAFKPGDIVQSLAGKTIEIMSTDAEGRLLLADALALAVQEQADMIVDMATLTGGCVVALGHIASGVMGNNQDLIDEVISAGERCAEKMWQLPLFEEYSNQIRSDVADLENSGGRAASTLTAGIFLREFVAGRPWVHIDIAGTSIMDKEITRYIQMPYLPKEGGTGVGVRSLICLVERLAQAWKDGTLSLTRPARGSDPAKCRPVNLEG